MKYTKVFEDTLCGRKYFVSECSLDKGTLRHLVLCEINGTKVVEVDNNYKGVTVKRVCHTPGDLIEISVEEFDKRFRSID